MPICGRNFSVGWTMIDADPRLKRLLVAIYTENDGERSNAASAFYRYLKQRRVHPSDIDLLIGVDLIRRNQDAISKLEEEIKRLSDENARLRHTKLATTSHEKLVRKTPPAPAKVVGRVYKRMLEYIYATHQAEEEALFEWLREQGETGKMFSARLCELRKHKFGEPLVRRVTLPDGRKILELTEHGQARARLAGIGVDPAA